MNVLGWRCLFLSLARTHPINDGFFVLACLLHVMCPSSGYQNIFHLHRLFFSWGFVLRFRDSILISFTWHCLASMLALQLNPLQLTTCIPQPPACRVRTRGDAQDGDRPRAHLRFTTCINCHKYRCCYLSPSLSTMHLADIQF